MRPTARALTAILVLAAMPAIAPADGFIVPVPRPDPERPEPQPVPFRGSWAVKYHHVDIKVRNQVASVSIDQAFVNTSGGMIEAEYFFPVPPGAAIDSMTLMVDGKEFAAELMKAEEARRIYEDTVRKMKDPALLEYAGYNLYRTKAFPLQPGKPARVLVTYKHVCRKDRDLVEVWYPLNTEKFSARPLETVRVKVDIECEADITAVYSPTHSLDVKREGPREIVATYKAKDTLPVTDFQVFYKAANEDVGATLLTHQPDEGKDGYFLLLVSPSPRAASRRAVPKDVMILLDTSGSMKGKKFEQAVDAVTYVLRNLNEEDRFNVIAYSDSVEPLFEGLVGADRAPEAVAKLDALEAGGGTAIHDALTTGMNLLSAHRAADGDRERNRPAYALFMTDGKPTIGKTVEADILKDSKAANRTDARLFAFGVGYEPNVRLLDMLVEQNSGRSVYVNPKESVETKVSSLYSKIRNPVMTDLQARMDGVDLSHLYPRELPDLFDGDQIVLTGRYDSSAAGDRRTLVIKGLYEGRERVFEYNVRFRPAGRDIRYVFVEKLWAMRRIGFLLDEIQLHGRSQEVIDEVVSLSLRYGIITPYTSFLAEEKTELADRDRVRWRALRETEILSRTDGAEGQVGAANRKAMKQAVAPPASEAVRKAPGAAPQRAATSVGYRDKDELEAGEGKATKDVATNVRQYDEQATYRRGRVWVAANAAAVDLEKDAEKIETVERFSDEYFELVRANTAGENQILAAQGKNEELVIRLRGQVYRIR